MANRGNAAKPLNGVPVLDAARTQSVTSGVTASFSSGAIGFNNIVIEGGTIDGTSIGTNNPGPIYGTTIVSGNNTGVGFDVIYYGAQPGEYFKWDSALGLVTISGGLDVTQAVSLDNISISGSTIGTISPNSSLILAPNGTGIISILNGITQNTSATDTYNVGGFVTNSSGHTALTTVGNTSINSTNGTVTIGSGAALTQLITFVGLGSTPTIVTNVVHGLVTGDIININSTNSIPVLSGQYTVTVVNSTQFTVTLTGPPITTQGNSGSFTRVPRISLNSPNVAVQAELDIGNAGAYINPSGSSLQISAAGTIALMPGGGSPVTIPSGSSLSIGSTNLSSTGVLTSSDITLSGNASNTGEIFHVATQSPIRSGKYRGLDFLYPSGPTTKLGFFGFDPTDNTFAYYLNATNTDNVISGTLGNAKFANATFTGTITLSSLTVPVVNTCNITCNNNLQLNATNSVSIPANVPLNLGSCSITGDSSTLTLNSSQVVVPGTLALGTGCLWLAGYGGTQRICSTSSTSTVYSAGYINLSPTSQGVTITEGLPLIFNSTFESRITGTSDGDLYINAKRDIRLNTNVYVPSNGRINLGTTYIYGTTDLFTNAINTSITSTLTSSLVATTINLTASSKIQIPANIPVILGNNTEYIRSDGSGNLLLNTSNSLNVMASAASITTSGIISLASSTSINVLENIPINLGATASIKGNLGVATLTATNTVVNSSSFTVAGTSAAFNVATVETTCPIPGVNSTSILGDITDKGIQYQYYSGIQKTGYFGIDTSLDAFTFYKNVTITNNIVSGVLGNCAFNSGSFIGIDMNGGSIGDISSISTTNAFLLQASSLELSGPVTIDNSLHVANLAISASGSDTIITANGNIDVTSSLVTFSHDVTVVGTLTAGTLVTGAVITPSVASVERISSGNPSTAINTSIVSGSYSATMNPSSDGFEKKVFYVGSGTFTLSFTNNLFDPGTGSATGVKIATFGPGQSIVMQWCNTEGYWFIVGGGCQIT